MLITITPLCITNLLSDVYVVYSEAIEGGYSLNEIKIAMYPEEKKTLGSCILIA